MMSKSVVTLTTAPAGTGKSYRRCGHFLLTELLPHTGLIHLSNFPIQFEPWGENNEKRGLIQVAGARGITEETVRSRVQVLPPEVVESWRDGNSGPWDYFESRSLAGHHLAIDEIHNFCGQNTHVAIKQKWQKWLGELRHRGARIEFISQHPHKIAKEIVNEAEVRLSLVGAETRVDPYFKINLRDWYNLKAKITGEYKPAIYEIHQRQYDGRWKDTKTVTFRFEADIFEVYDSFSAPIQGGERGEVEKEPWERFSWPRLLWWFYERNAWTLSWRSGAVAAFVWLTAFGGATVVAGEAKRRIKAALDEKNAARRGVVSAPADRDLEAIMAANPGAVVASPVMRPGVAAVEAPSAVPGVQVDAESVEQLVDAWRLAAITNSSVHFRNGEWFALEERISYGPFSDTVVESVDMVRRSASFSGSPVRVGGTVERVRQWAIAEVRRRQSDVRPAVQSSRSRAAKVERPSSE